MRFTAARRLTTGAGHHDNAVRSPDGRRLAFNADRDGANDLFVMDADGPGPRNLTRTPDVAEVVATRSPHGQALIVSANTLERAGLWPGPARRAAGVGLLAGLTVAAAVLRRRRRGGRPRRAGSSPGRSARRRPTRHRPSRDQEPGAASG
jgi:hypothetical protein